MEYIKASVSGLGKKAFMWKELNPGISWMLSHLTELSLSLSLGIYFWLSLESDVLTS